MGKHIIFAPHLDDEIIGCYSILDNIDEVWYFNTPERYNSEKRRQWLPNITYVNRTDNYIDDSIIEKDTVYIPSKYDHHPEHKRIAMLGKLTKAQLMYYSVEMNVPWLEEENTPEQKQMLLDTLYPSESSLWKHNAKYYLFKSIQHFDDIVFAEIRITFEEFHKWADAPDEVSFLRNLHRHTFYLTVRVQQFHDDRDVEYFILRNQVRQMMKGIEWTETTSCEMYALELKRALEVQYYPSIVQVELFEDNENGGVIL